MAFERSNAQSAGNSLMWRDDPIIEPWYELDFNMKRWQCPVGLPSSILEDVIEAIAEMDRILLDSMKLVDRYSYGWESSKKRYIRHSLYEIFRGEFERAEDGFLIARHGLAARWSSVLSEHQREIAGFPAILKKRMRHPDSNYAMSYTIAEIELDKNMQQFLESIQSGKELVFLPK
jgi:hypothetical protein